MPCITWNKSLSVDHPFLDRDHQALLDYVNVLHDELIRDEGRDLILKAFDELIQFTRAHFKREEAEMQLIGYADYELHKHEHDYLLEQILVLENKFNAGTVTLAVQVTLFLRDWLVNHIAILDKEFAKALAQREVA
ncbi:MAG: hemerythrin family protein [Burkholderiales bacterium]|nr:hemerythrin family protein [Burkholderiales bacterium]